VSRVERELEEYKPDIFELSEQAARDLAAAGSGKLSVAIGDEAGTYLVTPTQWVGAIVTPDVSVLVRPKVPLRNLFAMLDIGIPDDAWLTSDVGLNYERDLLAAVAAWFVRAADRALSRGVRRDYLRMRERVPTLRGRIDFPEQLRRPAFQIPLACEFDEYTADIPENRALRAATRRLMRMQGVRSETRRGLHRLLIGLEEVSDLQVDAASIDNIVVTRLNAHYRPALRLARLILHEATLVDHFGQTSASAFMLDMNALFERWVQERLRSALRDRLVVSDQPKNWRLDVDGKVRIEPDLVFADDLGSVVGVGDVKYKISDTGLGRTGDYYQLLAYTTAQKLSDGVLVYCLGDGRPVPRQVTVLGSGKRLHTWRLDLSGTSPDLDRSIDALADFVADVLAPSRPALAVAGA
jgi:5-methylcytosine-specific restriction enzyme subunit McrC